MTTEERIARLEQRVLKLEREIQDIRTGQAVLERVRAARIELLDGQGKVRAILAVDAEGPRPHLIDAEWEATVYKVAGETPAGADVSAGGPRLSLLDARGKVRAVLHLDRDGPHLGLLDAAEETRLVLGMSPVGPGLALCDATGTERANLSMWPEGDDPCLTLEGVGENRASLGVSKLALAHKGERAVLEVDVAGEPRLALNDAGEQERATLSLRESQAELRMTKGNPGPGWGDYTKASLRVDSDGAGLTLESCLDLSDSKCGARASLSACDMLADLGVMGRHRGWGAHLSLDAERLGLTLADTTGRVVWKVPPAAEQRE